MWVVKLFVIVFAITCGVGFVCLVGSLIWSGKLLLRGTPALAEHRVKMKVMEAEARTLIARHDANTEAVHDERMKALSV